MYRLAVGTGGLDPEYFLDRMGAMETQDYLDGMARRHRTAWEVGREVMRVTAAVGGCKRFDFPLPWDKEKQEAARAAAHRPDAREMERLRGTAARIAEKLEEMRKKKAHGKQ